METKKKDFFFLLLLTCFSNKRKKSKLADCLRGRFTTVSVPIVYLSPPPPFFHL